MTSRALLLSGIVATLVLAFARTADALNATLSFADAQIIAAQGMSVAAVGFTAMMNVSLKPIPLPAHLACTPPTDACSPFVDVEIVADKAVSVLTKRLHGIDCRRATTAHRIDVGGYGLQVARIDTESVATQVVKLYDVMITRQSTVHKLPDNAMGATTAMARYVNAAVPVCYGSPPFPALVDAIGQFVISEDLAQSRVYSVTFPHERILIRRVP